MKAWEPKSLPPVEPFVYDGPPSAPITGEELRKLGRRGFKQYERTHLKHVLEKERELNEE